MGFDLFGNYLGVVFADMCADLSMKEAGVTRTSLDPQNVSLSAS